MKCLNGTFSYLSKRHLEKALVLLYKGCAHLCVHRLRKMGHDLCPEEYKYVFTNVCIYVNLLACINYKFTNIYGYEKIWIGGLLLCRVIPFPQSAALIYTNLFNECYRWKFCKHIRVKAHVHLRCFVFIK